MDSSADTSRRGATSAQRRRGFALPIAAAGTWMLGSMVWSGAPALNTVATGLVVMLVVLVFQRRAGLGRSGADAS